MIWIRFPESESMPKTNSAGCYIGQIASALFETVLLHSVRWHRDQPRQLSSLLREMVEGRWLRWVTDGCVCFRTAITLLFKVSLRDAVLLSAVILLFRSSTDKFRCGALKHSYAQRWVTNTDVQSMMKDNLRGFARHHSRRTLVAAWWNQPGGF